MRPNLSLEKRGLCAVIDSVGVQTLKAMFSTVPGTAPTTKKVGLASELQILSITRDLLRAQARNLYVMRWSGECAVRDLSVVFREIRQLSNKYETVVVLSLLDPGSQPPNADGRALVAKHQAQMSDRLVLANLVDGQGFWASIVLNALLGIQNSMSSRLDKERVFRKREEACSWVQPFVVGNASAHDVAEVIRRCREAATGTQRVAS